MDYKPGIDKELKYYVDYVKQLSSDFSEVDSVTFYYEKPKNKSDKYFIGFCSFNFNNWANYVKINRYWWDKASDRERIILMAHELKHCSCKDNWKHIDYKNESDCGANYMSSFLPNPFCIRLHYNDYIKQIRRGCNDT
jgi:hypothetical protein